MCSLAGLTGFCLERSLTDAFPNALCDLLEERDSSHTVDSTTLTARQQTDSKGCFAMTQRSHPRFQMWVDAVGGFLVCLSDEVLIGQAIPDSSVDIPVFGDLSRKHATLRREGEVFLIDPIATTLVEERQIEGPQSLSDGDQIRLGNSVVLRFRQPHALSSTCRLEFVSPHRTQPSSDAVIVMANTCLLGPGENNHVICRKWGQDVVLVRQENDLRCHSKAPLEIDGHKVDGKADIQLNSRISGPDFCISLEPID